MSQTTMGVPFVDLKAQYHSIKAEIDAALIGTMESCAFTLGPEVAQLEKDFAVYAGTNFAAGVNNGTSALHLALLAAGVGPGDEVITVPFTFIASASAILSLYFYFTSMSFYNIITQTQSPLVPFLFLYIGCGIAGNIYTCVPV